MSHNSAVCDYSPALQATHPHHPPLTKQPPSALSPKCVIVFPISWQSPAASQQYVSTLKICKNSKYAAMKNILHDSVKYPVWVWSVYITGAIHTSTRLILWPQQYNLYLLQYHLHLSTYNCYEEIIPKHINYVSVFSPSVNTDQNSLYYIVKLLSVRCSGECDMMTWHPSWPRVLGHNRDTDTCHNSDVQP